MHNRLKSILGLARRANRISLGTDAVIESIRKNSAKLIVVSSDASANTVENIKRKSKDVAILKIKYDMDFIGSAIGKKCAVISINDEGFSKTICRLIEEEEDILWD